MLLGRIPNVAAEFCASHLIQEIQHISHLIGHWFIVQLSPGGWLITTSFMMSLVDGTSCVCPPPVKGFDAGGHLRMFECQFYLLPLIKLAFQIIQDFARRIIRTT
jgi:hypothetical protein